MANVHADRRIGMCKSKVLYSHDRASVAVPITEICAGHG